MCVCHRTYLRICASSSPVVLTQSPFAQKCRPLYRRFSSKCRSNTLIVLLPLMKPIVSAIEYFGDTLSPRCIWSFCTSPSRISTCFHSHSYRMISLIEYPTSPLRIRNRYFGHHATWYLHSHTACANLLNRLIEYLLQMFRASTTFILKEVFVFRITHAPAQQSWDHQHS
jgi:hypothetical protein